MMLVGVGTAIAQQAVGIDAIQYYLIDVIERLGIPSDTNQSSIILILLGTLKLTMIVVGGQLFDKHGRRPLIFISLNGMALALLAISVIFFVETSLRASVTNMTVLVGSAILLSLSLTFHRHQCALMGVAQRKTYDYIALHTCSHLVLMFYDLSW